MKVKPLNPGEFATRWAPVDKRASEEFMIDLLCTAAWVLRQVVDLPKGVVTGFELAAEKIRTGETPDILKAWRVDKP